MGNWWVKYENVCHWCGIHYTAKKGRLQARFHSKACKQAHYRAYKNYVTVIRRRKRFARSVAVTPKKARKRGDKRGKFKK